jgi:hypothetical protein
MGSLPPEIHSDLELFREFMMLREKALIEIMGAPHRTSQLREGVLRQMMLAFTDGRIMRVSDYQRLCARFASPPAIRTEISRLEGRKVLILQNSAEDRRAIEVWPTQRTIEWYKRHIPEIRRKLINLAKGLRSVK